MQRIDGAELHREVDVGTALGRVAGQRLGPRQRVDALGVVRADGRRALQPAKAGVEIALQPVRPPHCEVHERIQGVEVESPLRVAPGQRDLAVGVVGLAHEGRLEVNE
ncbi:MAG: hypothetical protein ACN6I7_00830 [bacterium]